MQCEDLSLHGVRSGVGNDLHGIRGLLKLEIKNICNQWVFQIGCPLNNTDFESVHLRKRIRQIHHVLLYHRDRVRVLADDQRQRALSYLCKLLDTEANKWIFGFEPVSIASTQSRELLGNYAAKCGSNRSAMQRTLRNAATE